MNTKISPVDIAAFLDSEEAIAAYLQEVTEQGDRRLVEEALADVKHARHLQGQRELQRSGDLPILSEEARTRIEGLGMDDIDRSDVSDMSGKEGWYRPAGWRRPPEQIPFTEHERRQQKVRRGLATMDVDGFAPDMAIQAAARRWVDGEITMAKLLAILRGK